jgi:methylmalonyl-CoA/ethylmalonyl-CoA epimerase
MLPAIALDHIGIAAPSPVTALSHLLSNAPGDGTLMPSGVRVARFGPGDSLELVWPAAEQTPVTRFLERRGPGLHHIAFRVVEPIGDIASRLTRAGVELVGSVVPSSDGRPSVFVHPRCTGGVLVELVEGPS